MVRITGGGVPQPESRNEKKNGRTRGPALPRENTESVTEGSVALASCARRLWKEGGRGGGRAPYRYTTHLLQTARHRLVVFLQEKRLPQVRELGVVDTPVARNVSLGYHPVHLFFVI